MNNGTPMVGIIAGHSALAPGVKFDGWQEEHICRDVADALGEMLIDSGYHVIDPRFDLRNLHSAASLHWRVGAFNFAQPDIAVELHLNSTAKQLPDTNYSCVLHAGSVRGERLASLLSQSFSVAFGVPDYGAWERRDENYFVRETDMTAVVCEPLHLPAQLTRDMLVKDYGVFVDRMKKAYAFGIRQYFDMERV